VLQNLVDKVSRQLSRRLLGAGSGWEESPASDRALLDVPEVDFEILVEFPSALL
jgi:hypothetical protein